MPKVKIEMTLIEKIDDKKLRLITSADGIDIELKNQLKAYRNKRSSDNKTVRVEYAFSKNLEEEGRLYAIGSLSLQNFKRSARHYLAKDFYHDIDMVNAHPNLILQYCVRNNIDSIKLAEYVVDRENILKRIMKYHEITRDDAKKLMLRLCYLGNYVIEKEVDGILEEEEPDRKMKLLIDFQKEMREIATSVCDLNTELYEKIKKKESTSNNRSSTLSVLAQKLEHSCLMAMYEFFTKRDIKVGTLCFDGLMIEKSTKTEKLETLLPLCEKYVKQKTKYTVQLDEKIMEDELKFEIPEFDFYVESDQDCQVKLFQIEGADKFHFCKGELYVYNEKTGMYDTTLEAFNHYLIKNQQYLNIIVSRTKDGEKNDNYGTNTILQKRAIQAVKNASVDDEWFEKTDHTSRGYLLFRNGIYDMKKSKFTKGFNPKIVFHERISYNFPEKNEEELNKAFKLSFGACLEESEPLILALACAIAGDIGLKRFYFCPGQSNAGKSFIARMMQNTFGGYVSEFDINNLSISSKNDTRDEAQKLRWLLKLKYKRMCYSNEADMNKSINGNILKKVASGGDRMTSREHHKHEVNFVPHCTFFSMLNDIPPITPLDKGVENRATFIEFPYVFVSKKELKNSPKNKLKDDDLERKISEQSFINGFLHIILEGYKRYLENGLPKYNKNIKEEWFQDSKQGDLVIETIKKHYEITNKPEHKITVKELKDFKTNNKEFKSISLFRFKEILTEKLLLSEIKSGNSRYWKGIKRRDVEVVLEDEDD